MIPCRKIPLALLLIAAAAWTTGCAHLSPGARTVDLVIMAGQSNMVGPGGNARHYPADPAGLDEGALIYWEESDWGSSKGEWRTLGPQPRDIEALPAIFGPEIAFARFMALDGMQPAVFKFAKGGTGLDQDWLAPGEGGLTDRMAAAYPRAIEGLRRMGLEPRLRAMVWVQGESDARNPESARLYRQRLEAFLDFVRNDLIGRPDLPVVLSVDEQHPSILAHPGVVEAHRAIADADQNIMFVSMYGLEKIDETHLTPLGLGDHGRRLYEAYRVLTRRPITFAPKN